MLMKTYRPVADGAGSVEWIPGVPGRWLYPFLAAVPLLVGSVLYLLGSLGEIPATPTNIEAAFAILTIGVLTAIPLHVARLYAPFNRRIGLSVDGLHYHNGIRDFRFAWDDLGWLSPTRLTASRGARSYLGLRLNLTVEQAQRVREFMERGEGAQGAPRPWISIYDPR